MFSGGWRGRSVCTAVQFLGSEGWLDLQEFAIRIAVEYRLNQTPNAFVKIYSVGYEITHAGTFFTISLSGLCSFSLLFCWTIGFQGGIMNGNT